MASRYKRFMRLLDTWPAEPERGVRDFGGFIRKKIAAAFPSGEGSVVSSPAECDQIYASLQKINSDHYREKYARTVEEKGCTGLTSSQLKSIMSQKGMKELSETHKGRFEKFKDFFTRKKKKN